MRRAKRTTNAREAEASLRAQGNLLPSISGKATATPLAAPGDLIQKVGSLQGGGGKEGRYEEGVQSLRPVGREGQRQENRERTHGACNILISQALGLSKHNPNFLVSSLWAARVWDSSSSVPQAMC